MKKRIYVIIIASFLLLCACQPTPEEPVVIQKDFDVMIEKAKATPVTDTVIINSETPNSAAQPTEATETAKPGERVVDSFIGRSENFKVTIDAKVIRPDGPLPIVHIKPTEFTPETAQKYFDVLTAGHDLYTQEQLETKPFLEAMIADFQDQLDNWIPTAVFESEDQRKEEAKYLKQLIKEYQEKWKTAKDDPGEPVRNIADYKDLHFLSADRDYKVQFSWRPNSTVTYGKKTVTYLQSGISFVDRTRYPETTSGSFMKCADVTGQTTVPHGTDLKKTPVDAQREAEALLAAIGIEDMVTDRVFLMQEMVLSEGKEGYAINRELPADYQFRYLYEVRFNRIVNGVQVSDPSPFASSSSHDETIVAPEWDYESLIVWVSDLGICQFDQRAPIEVMETKVSDATLLPFDRILEIAKKMIPIIYEDPLFNNDQITGMEFHFTRITLSLQRISERDNMNYGLLTPVWNFWGTQLYHYEDGSMLWWNNMDSALGPCSAYPLLSINAVDGSIIDPQKGY